MKTKITSSSYHATISLYHNIKKLSHYIHGKTIDIGCGNKPYENLFNVTEYIGMDIYGVHDHKDEKIDIFYDGNTFPIADCSFDSAICTQVLEHIEEPNNFLLEINRILKPGGILLITVPFVWCEHEVPYDFTRFSSFGIKYNLNKNHFDIVEQKKSTSDIKTIFQLFNSYFISISSEKRKVLKLIISSIILFNNICSKILHHILPEKGVLYLDNIIIAKKR